MVLKDDFTEYCFEQRRPLIRNEFIGKSRSIVGGELCRVSPLQMVMVSEAPRRHFLFVGLTVNSPPSECLSEAAVVYGPHLQKHELWVGF